MALRKEQVLAGLSLLLGAWIFSGLGDNATRRLPYAPKALEYAPKPVRPAPLVAEAPAAAARRVDLCTEPSETRPLPPRDLQFPPRPPLSVAMLPLDPGPDFAHALELLAPGAPTDGVTIQTADSAPVASEGAGAAEEPALPSRAEREARAARTYDRVYLQGQTSPFFGTLELDGGDPFALEARTDFDGVVVKLRSYSVDTGKVGNLVLFGRDDRQKVRKVELANTLRNEVQRRIRRVPVDAGHLQERAELVAWLLEQARETGWVYDEALAQADLYMQASGGDLEGLRLQQKVLRAKGDLGAEFALLDGIQGPHRESAFRYEGLGVLKARLGLHADAEADLRRAAQLGATDARPHAALAEFLRRRARSAEAVAAAQRAEAAFGGLLDPADKVRVVRAIVACRLAVADFAGAQKALDLLPTDLGQPYLRGCLAYAQGQLPAALTAFQQAAGGADGAAALLGQAATLLRQAQWQEAHDLLRKVADQDPLLRHRACGGLGLLFVRLGQYDSALPWLDRALEADPTDAYAHYLRGRALRLQGSAAAQDALLAALKLHDDFVPAIAEMAALQGYRATEASGEEAASAALAAVKYGDRAVELAHRPLVELLELQGLHHFAGADPRGARDAFLAARELAADEAQKLFAKGALAVVDYSRGLFEDAVAALQRLTSDVPKDQPIHGWAVATLEAIDLHAQKEMLEDRFERTEVGSIWLGERDGSLGAAIKDGQLVFQGRFSRTGNGLVFVERAGAVQKGRNFLAAACVLQLGPGQPRGEGFAGLRLETQRGSGQYDTRIQLGVREGKPFLRLEEAREEPQQVELQIPGLDLSAPHELELRFLPAAGQGRTFVLQARWNGAVVHQKELKSISASTGTELKTILFAEGGKGSEVDARFDDYRLERNKER